MRNQVMERMGWSWREYRETPVGVIRQLLKGWDAEALARKHGNGK